MQCFFSNWWLQTDKVIYFATEPVVPLENYLQNNSDSHNETAISWGLHQVLVRSEKTHQSNVEFNNNNNGILLVSQNLPHGYRCFTALDKQHPYWLHIYLSWNTRTYIHTGDIYISVGTLAHTYKSVHLLAFIHLNWENKSKLQK